MRINKKSIKHIKRRCSSNFSRIDQIIRHVNYKEVSPLIIHRRGSKMMKDIRKYFAYHQGYRPRDSRMFSFNALKRGTANTVNIYGFVGGYRLVFSNYYHRAFLYILLKYVFGETYNNHYKYLSDHLWIDVNRANHWIEEPVTVGIGDCIQVYGEPTSYSGRIGEKYGFKYSLKKAVITAYGYPLIRNGHFTFKIIPYNHGRKFIYEATAKRTPNVILGNEISRNDIKKINSEHYKIGESFITEIGLVIHKGLHPRATHNHDPFLIARITNAGKFKVKWTMNNFSIKKNYPLTTARALQAHPRQVETEVDNKLKKEMHKFHHKIIKQEIDSIKKG